MGHSDLAKVILRLVGDKENIADVVHCATRLRFSLHDNAVANKAELQATEGVLSVVESGGQFQVIIGSHVSHVFNEIKALLGGQSTASKTANVQKKDVALSARVFEVISGSLTPLVGAMAGAGMLKAVLAVLTMLNWIDPKSGTYLIISAASNAVFYFLPILLGVSAAIKMGANAYVGGAIGAALLEPNFTGLIGSTTATFLGVPVVAINYSSTVFPIFIAIAILSVVERFLKKICPNNLQMFLVPMFSMLIIVPLTILVFGPFGVNVGNWIAAGINWLTAHSGIATGAVIGASMMFLVVLGLHWGIVPIIIANLAAGGDAIAAMWAPCTFAQMGVALAVFLRSKDVNVKAIAGPAAVTGLLAGVTEPIIYGIILKFRRTMPIVAVCGAIGGAINGYFQTKMTAFAFHSLMSIPVFSPLVPYIVGISVGFGLALVITLFTNFEKQS